VHPDFARSVGRGLVWDAGEKGRGAQLLKVKPLDIFAERGPATEADGPGKLLQDFLVRRHFHDLMAHAAAWSEYCR